MNELEEIKKVVTIAKFMPNKVSDYCNHPFYLLLESRRVSQIWFANPALPPDVYEEIRELIRQLVN